MVRDVIDRDRIIGIVLLRDLQDTGKDQVPRVFPIGCAGLITHSEQLKNGRYNVVLRGLNKFRILDEDYSRSYRQAHTEMIVEEGTQEGLRHARQRLERSIELPSRAPGSQSALSANLEDGNFINALSQHLQFEPLEKQALLEQNDLLERCQSLIDLLEIKTLTQSNNCPVSQVQ